MTTLEDWIKGIDNCHNCLNLIKKFGVYNNLAFWLKLSEDKKKSLLKTLDSSNLEFWGKEIQIPNFYRTDFEDRYRYGVKDYFQMTVLFPNKGIVFKEGSPLGEQQIGKEIGFKYDCEVRSTILGSEIECSRYISSFAKNFIVANQVQSYVMPVNSENKKYQMFSYLIND